jgi:hypothetical protein
MEKMNDMQYPRHHHRLAERGKSLFRVNLELIKRIISQSILIRDDANAA